jgi:alanine transaminase
MVNPPKKNDMSYELYEKEKNYILSELKEKAEILGTELNKIPGMHIKIPRGAMYAFVRFDLPKEEGVDSEKMSVEERLRYESSRDNDYCLKLLEETGICVVPGSGFGQKPGTFHFRMTFLPPKDEIKSLVEKMHKFHINYISNYHKEKIKK